MSQEFLVPKEVHMHKSSTATVPKPHALKTYTRRGGNTTPFAADGSEYDALRCGRFIPQKRNSLYSLDRRLGRAREPIWRSRWAEKSFLYRESKPGLPTRNQSLNWLRYPGSTVYRFIQSNVNTFIYLHRFAVDGHNGYWCMSGT
jgi:hypothetical protein